MPRDRLIPIRDSQYRAIEKWIKSHPDQGYHSVSEAMREAGRDWLKKKKLEETHFIVEVSKEID